MNLESKIYRLSFELSEEFEENDLNKLLGILASDGVYAMWVYAKDKFECKFSKNKKEMIKQKCFKLLKIISKLSNFSSKKLEYCTVLKEIAELTDNIDKLKEEIGKLKKPQNDKKFNEEKKKKIEKYIKEIERKEKKRNQILNKYFQDLAQDLNELLFMKELLEKVLIYAIYHAKAKGD